MRRQTEHYYLFGPFRLDAQESRLQRDGLLIPLTPKAFAMLLVLVRNSGSLVEKEFLMSELWPDAFVEEANLTFNISVIRKALGESAQTTSYIETVPKRGYRFIAPVQEIHTENEVKSLAVLPFVDLSPLEGNEYFADGMQDALTSELAQIRSLRVISRTSSMQYKSATTSLSAFARRLHLDFAVEGSLLVQGDHVRINVRLIDAINDRHLWAQNYDRHAKDVHSWQAEVARSIARKIGIKLTPREDARLANVHPVDPEGHAAYLRGRYYWHQFFTESGLNTAIAHFRRAIDLEPSHARAWSGLADCYSGIGVQSMLSPAEAAMQGKTAAQQALALDPSLAEAHNSMAAIDLFFEWNWPAAELAMRSAMELRPSYSLARGLFTHYALARGWGPQAIASARAALDLDPMSAAMNTDLAWAYLLSGDHGMAMEQCLHTLLMGFNFPLTHIYLTQAYLCAGLFEKAVAHMRLALPSDAEGWAPSLAMLGYAYGLSGKPEAARGMLRRIEQLSKRCYVSPFDHAVIYAGLGEKNDAIRCLEQAFQDGSPRIIWLKLDPTFESLREDRRFQAMVDRLKLD